MKSTHLDPSRSRRSRRLGRRDALLGFVFILPWIVGFLGLTVGPMVASAVLAFARYDFLRPIRWVGFGNFVSLFTKDYYFWNSLWVTLKWVLFREPVFITLSLVAAMLVASSTRGAGLFRTLFYMAGLVAGTVSAAVMWKMLLGKDGQVNAILALAGIEPIAWFQDPRYAFFALAVTSMIGFGGLMVVFLAGLKNITETLYEAAVMDGAGWFQRFFRITLPMLSPVLFFALVMGTIYAFQQFTAAFVISRGTGGPLSTTMFYMINLYRNAFQYSRAGYASSMAWVLFWIIILATLLIFRSSNLWVFYETEVKSRRRPRRSR